MLCIQSFAQTVTLTFTGHDAANNYVQLNRVAITDMTKGWQETIYWPDTVLSMQNGTGVEDYIIENSLFLSQNTPNPFNGETEVSLNMLKQGEVLLTMYDMNGKQIAKYSDILDKGRHAFKIRLSVAQTYLLQALVDGQSFYIKMVNNGSIGNNEIVYVGEGTPIVYNLKSSTTNPFTFGDMMEYVGYATINGGELESQRITQAQGTSQTFTLQFTETQYQLPTVTTLTVSNISETNATCGGIITADGGTNVIVRGVCWSTSHNPTTADNHTTDGNGTGSFTSNITNLSTNTTYYVRAYAINSVGTAYGNEVSFTTTFAAQLPSVTTIPVSDVTDTSATCGGTVTTDGGAAVIERGVCWSISQNPTTADSHTTDGNGGGSFTSSITNLTANTTYYVRAYAINSVGVAYGNEVSFTTQNGSNTDPQDGQPCPGTATLTDIDGNVYNTVQIGQQCWMKENLRTTHYANGTSISLGSSTSTTTAYRYSPNNSSSNVSTYGYLYNWKAVMGSSSSSNTNPSGVQGICPTGWHVPSDAEWTQLTNYVGSQTQYQCNNNSDNIAKALASTTGWDGSTYTCEVGNNPSANNSTGFSALPAGRKGGLYYYFGTFAYFWSATEATNYNAWYRSLCYSSAYVSGSYDDGVNGFSVRCVRD